MVAAELGTLDRADARLREIDAEIKRNTNNEARVILRAERARVDAARQLLLGAPAAAPAPAPSIPPQSTASPIAQNTANAVLAATPVLIQTDPARLSQAMQDTQAFAQQQRALLVRQRNDQAQLARMYMNSISVGPDVKQRLMAQVGQADLALQQFDMQMRDAMIYMQGMQGLQEFAATNNPSRLVGVWSYFTGAPIGVQPRSDGKFNLFYNGEKYQEGLTKQQVQESAQVAMFQSARDAIAKSAALENELALKAKYGPERINAMKDIWVAIINGQAKVAEEQAKAAQGKLTVDSANQGAWLQFPNGVFWLSKSGKPVEVPGVGSITPVTAQPVTGLGR